jgi:hypothetical protein
MIGISALGNSILGTSAFGISILISGIPSAIFSLVDFISSNI